MAASVAHHENFTRSPKLKFLYLKLTDSGIHRAAYFGAYFAMSLGGIVAIAGLPIALVDVVGHPLVTLFGVLGLSGSVLAMAGVAANIHWLERVGIILLFTSVIIYVVMMLYSPGIPISLFFATALSFSVGNRLVEIR